MGPLNPAGAIGLAASSMGVSADKESLGANDSKACCSPTVGSAIEGVVPEELGGAEGGRDTARKGVKGDKAMSPAASPANLSARVLKGGNLERSCPELM